MDIITSDKTINFKLAPLEKLFSLHRDFSIPKDNIISIKEGRPPLWKWWQVRAPGTFIPGLIKAGTFYTKENRKEFWFWTINSKYTFTINLKNSSHNLLVLGLTHKFTSELTI